MHSQMSPVFEDGKREPNPSCERVFTSSTEHYFDPFKEMNLPASKPESAPEPMVMNGMRETSRGATNSQSVVWQGVVDAVRYSLRLPGLVLFLSLALLRWLLTPLGVVLWNARLGVGLCIALSFFFVEAANHMHLEGLRSSVQGLADMVEMKNGELKFSFITVRLGQ